MDVIFHPSIFKHQAKNFLLTCIVILADCGESFIEVRGCRLIEFSMLHSRVQLGAVGMRLSSVAGQSGHGREHCTSVQAASMCGSLSPAPRVKGPGGHVFYISALWGCRSAKRVLATPNALFPKLTPIRPFYKAGRRQLLAFTTPLIFLVLASRVHSAACLP